MTGEETKATAESLGRTHYVKARIELPKPVACVGGEGLWVLIDDEAAAIYCKDTSGDRLKATLANDSIFFAELYSGAEVVLITQGVNKPLIVLDPEWEVSGE